MEPGCAHIPPFLSTLCYLGSREVESCRWLEYDLVQCSHFEDEETEAQRRDLLSLSVHHCAQMMTLEIRHHDSQPRGLSCLAPTGEALTHRNITQARDVVSAFQVATFKK